MERGTQQCQGFPKIPSFIWLPSSPDLSDIENVQNLLKNGSTNGLQGLKDGKMKEVIVEEWDNISEKTLAFVDSMP